MFFHHVKIRGHFFFNQREICTVMKEVYDLIGVYIFVNSYETVHSNLYSLMHVYIMPHFFKKKGLTLQTKRLVPVPCQFYDIEQATHLL